MKLGTQSADIIASPVTMFYRIKIAKSAFKFNVHAGYYQASIYPMLCSFGFRQHNSRSVFSCQLRSGSKRCHTQECNVNSRTATHISDALSTKNSSGKCVSNKPSKQLCGIYTSPRITKYNQRIGSDNKYIHLLDVVNII